MTFTKCFIDGDWLIILLDTAEETADSRLTDP